MLSSTRFQIPPKTKPCFEKFTTVKKSVKESWFVLCGCINIGDDKNVVVKFNFHKQYSACLINICSCSFEKIQEIFELVLPHHYYNYYHENKVYPLSIHISTAFHRCDRNEFLVEDNVNFLFFKKIKYYFTFKVISQSTDIKTYDS